MVQSWNLLRTQNKVTSLGAPQNKPKEASRLVSPTCLPTATQRDTHGHEQQHGNLCSASGSISQAGPSVHPWAEGLGRDPGTGEDMLERDLFCSKPTRAGENLENLSDPNGIGQGEDE